MKTVLPGASGVGGARVRLKLAALVVFLEVVIDIWGVVSGFRDPAILSVPGGTIRALVMGTLGYLFIAKGRRWARVSFAAIEFATGVTALVLALASIQAGRVEVDATMAAIVCGYVAAGLLVSFAGAPTRGRSNGHGVADG
jgi:hypothetical protein